MTETVNEYLSKRFNEVSPIDYYSSIFPIGSLEKKGEYNTGQYCAIAIQINQENGKTRRVHITDGLPQLPDLLKSDEFLIMSPCSFAGRNATNQNSRFLFAFQFDLDFLRVKDGKLDGATNLLYQTSLLEEPDPLDRLPTPTYIIATSPRNCHLVYQLERPIAMYENVVSQVREFRKAFIPKVWDSWITTAFEEPQFETSPAHAFRMVGSWDKSHTERVRAFKTGEKVSLETMNKYVPEEARIITNAYKSKMSLAEAKKKYPQWYERRIESNQPAYTFKSHRGMYDWLKGKQDEIKVGHRYYYLVCLCAFAIKCGITQDELMYDLTQARKELDKLSPPDNPLTMSDMVKAVQAFDEKSRFMKRETTARLCGIEILPSKRNGRKRAEHIRYMNGIRNLRVEMGEVKITGRPSKKDIVISCLEKHPDWSVSKIARETGVSRPTVYKWIEWYSENQSNEG